MKRTCQLLFFTFVFLDAAAADVLTWTGAAGNNNWHSAGNWDANRLPGPDDDVVIPELLGDVLVQISTASATVNSLACAETLSVIGDAITPILTVNGPSQITGSLLLDSGRLQGNGDITVTGQLRARQTARAEGLGIVFVQPGGTLRLEAPLYDQLLTLFFLKPIVNAGLVEWSSGANDGDVFLGASGLHIEPSGTFRTARYGILLSGPIRNSGVILQDWPDGGYARLAGSLINGGLLEIRSGGLRLQSGGSNVGEMRVGSAGTLEFAADFSLDQQHLPVGTGTVTFSGGVHEISGAWPPELGLVVASYSSPPTEMTFHSDYLLQRFSANGGYRSIIRGPGRLTVTQDVDFGGQLEATASLVIAPGATGVVGGRIAGEVENHGVITTHSFYFEIDGGAIVNAPDGQWTWDYVREVNPVGAGGTFHNQGLLNAATADTCIVRAPLVNDGELRVENRRLELAGGGANHGVISLQQPGELSLLAPFDFSGGGWPTGDGLLSFSAGTYNISGPFYSGPISVYSNATVNLDGDYSFPAIFKLMGRVGGSGAFNFSTLDWDLQGILEGSGPATAGTLILRQTNSGNIKSLRRPLLVTNSGRMLTTTHSTNYLDLQNATLESQTQFAIDTFSVISGGATGGSFINRGSLTGTSSAVFQCPFINAGTSNIGLTFFAGGSSSGPMRGTLTFSGGVFTFEPSASLFDNGTIQFNSGTVDFQCPLAWPGIFDIRSPSQVRFGTDSLIDDLRFAGSRIEGSGNLSVRQLSWTSGTLAGAGTLVLNPGGSSTISSGTKTLSRVLLNNQTLTWSAQGTGFGFNAGRLENQAGGIVRLDSMSPGSQTIGVTGDVASSRFVNHGTINKRFSGTIALAVPFENHGAVTVEQGALRVTGGGSNAGPIAASANAAFDLASDFATTAPGQFTGSGSLVVSGGAPLFDGASIATAALQILTPGTARFLTPTALPPTVTLTGSMAGPAAVTAPGALTWSAPGTIAPSAHLVVAPGATLITAGTGIKTLQGVIENHGTITWAANTGNLIFDGGTLSNESGGIFNANSATAIQGGATVGRFQNAGLFSRLGSGTTTILVPFENTGLLTVAAAAELALFRGLTNFDQNVLSGGQFQVAGILRFTDADIVTNSADVTLGGAGARIQDHTGANAFTNFTVNSSAGNFSLTGGAALTTTSHFLNHGQFSVGSGCTFTAVAGYSQEFGQTLVRGTLASDTFADFRAGRLAGDGDVQASTTANAIVAPGLSPGRLTFLRTLALGPGTLIELELAGDTPGTQYDQLYALDAITIDGGILNLSLTPGFEPLIGSEFTILLGASVSGGFDCISLPILPAGRSWRIDRTPSALTLVVVPTSSCPGDLDGDGTVGLQDLSMILSRFGTQCPEAQIGDFDRDGDVDLSDLAIVLSRFGEICS